MSERFAVTRTLNATPAEVFAVLTDPARHRHTEPGDWVRDAIDPVPIDREGQIFSMNMYLDLAGGDYVIDNKVVTFDRDHAIAWEPGTSPNGEWQRGGWWWRYDLAPAPAGGTDVTLTYDWTDTPQEFRDQVGGMPPFPVEFLDQSLEALAGHIAG